MFEVIIGFSKKNVNVTSQDSVLIMIVMIVMIVRDG